MRSESAHSEKACKSQVWVDAASALRRCEGAHWGENLDHLCGEFSEYVVGHQVSPGGFTVAMDPSTSAGRSVFGNSRTPWKADSQPLHSLRTTNLGGQRIGLIRPTIQPTISVILGRCTTYSADGDQTESQLTGADGLPGLVGIGLLIRRFRVRIPRGALAGLDPFSGPRALDRRSQNSFAPPATSEPSSLWMAESSRASCASMPTDCSRR